MSSAESILGALFLAAVLGELPAFGLYEVLGMLLAIAGFPIVTAQLAFDDDLLTLLSQRSEALAGLTPHGHVCESSDLLAFTIPVVEEFIVSNSGGCNRSTGISFSQGWVSDQVTTVQASPGQDQGLQDGSGLDVPPYSSFGIVLKNPSHAKIYDAAPSRDSSPD